MFPRPESTTETLSLEAFCARLQTSRAISAIVLGGSAATGMNPSSDIDIAVVVDRHPCPARTGTTWVEGRLTDLGFASKSEVLEGLAGGASGRPDDWLTIMAAGRVIYDRDGIFSGRASRQVFETPRSEVFHRWDHTSYNLAQSERYVQSGDPLYADALRLRMTYQLADLMLDYFAVLHMPWQGEKVAIRYWDTHDPQFKAGLLSCLAENDLERKFTSYEKLVHWRWSRPANRGDGRPFRSRPTQASTRTKPCSSGRP